MLVVIGRLDQSARKLAGWAHSFSSGESESVEAGRSSHMPFPRLHSQSPSSGFGDGPDGLLCVAQAAHLKECTRNVLVMGSAMGMGGLCNMIYVERERGYHKPKSLQLRLWMHYDCTLP